MANENTFVYAFFVTPMNATAPILLHALLILCVVSVTRVPAAVGRIT